MTRVVYILGLSRSGSTFLEFLLSRQESIVGVGELDHLMRAHRAAPAAVGTTTCSCGLAGENCPLWRNILPQLNTSDRSDAFSSMLKLLSEQLPGKVLVDSSKTRAGLSRYLDVPDVQVQIIALVRDFRGWTWSVKKARAKQGRSRPTPLIWGYRWLYANGRGLLAGLRSRYPLLAVSYENLVFNTEPELARIGAFLNLDLSQARSQEPVHHDLFGNPMKLDPARATSTRYDHSWVSDRRWTLASPLLAPVYVANSLFQKASKAREGD